MCGILAEFNISGGVSGESFGRSMSKMKHRGPDGNGVLTADELKVVLHSHITKSNNKSAEELDEDFATLINTLDIDGDGEPKALTDGLLLIRYLFGFSGDSLVSGAIGTGAERDTTEEIESHIKSRLPRD